MRVVAVVPHPDDEAYAMGGTLARLAHQGCEVTVLALTWGERGGDPQMRREELARSCAALGVLPPRGLSWPDGAGPTWASRAHELGAALGDLSPQLVLGLGGDGVYGHIDHLAAHQVLRDTLLSFSLAPRLLECAFPPGLFAGVRRVLTRVHPTWVDTRPSLGAPQAHWDVRVDVTPWRERKLAAVAAHASQLPQGDVYRFLRPGLLAQLLTEERFTCVMGPPLPRGPGPAWVTDPLAGLA